MNKAAKVAIPAVAALTIAGCADMGKPRTTTEGVAYAGATLQSVQQSAAKTYPQMPKAQARDVHSYIGKAVDARKAARRATQAGNEAAEKARRASENGDDDRADDLENEASRHRVEAQRHVAEAISALQSARDLINKYNGEN